MTGPAQPEVEAGAMDEAASQTEEEANVVEAQSLSWDAPSATGQGSSWRSWSWYAPSATGQDESWDDRYQQSNSWKHGSSDSRSSNGWGAGARGATEDDQRLRRQTAFPCLIRHGRDNKQTETQQQHKQKQQRHHWLVGW